MSTPITGFLFVSLILTLGVGCAGVKDLDPNHLKQMAMEKGKNAVNNALVTSCNDKATVTCTEYYGYKPKDLAREAGQCKVKKGSWKTAACSKKMKTLANCSVEKGESRKVTYEKSMNPGACQGEFLAGK